MKANGPTLGSVRVARLHGWVAGLLFLVLAVVLTWPLAASPERAVSVRGDYFSNLWNFWWVRSALSAGTLPWQADVLHHPLGIDLARHTLSPVNALPGGLLTGWLGPHDAYKVLLLIHFWLSGWFSFLFVRRLTDSTGGAVLAGIAWTFSPFHGYYFAQMNLATLEFIPLAAFFMVGIYRDGGRGNFVGMALATALLAGSSSYYVVYVALLGLLLFAGGRLWDPELPWKPGALRLTGAGALAATVVLAVSWPLIAATLAGNAEASGPALRAATAAERSNDLQGFLWVGGPEEVVVSWPTMLGYTSLLLLLLGLRGVIRRPYWIGMLLLFLTLSLGPELSVAGEATGQSLPYAWLSDLPLLSMLRKPDRLVLMVELALGVLLAYAWSDVSARLPSGRWRGACVTTLALLLALERAPLPAATYEIPTSPYLATIAADPDVEVVLDLPPQGYESQAARRNFLQTLHNKKIIEGYATNLALSSAHAEAAKAWKNANQRLTDKKPGPVLKLARETGIDLIVLHRTEPKPRERETFPASTIWTPFCFARQKLLAIRQQGPFLESALLGSKFTSMRRTLREELGSPIHVDDQIVVFRCVP